MRIEGGRDYPEIEPRLFSFNSPLGACPNCEGFGNVTGLDMDVIVPDPTKTLGDGAIAPWNTPGYAHEREELDRVADEGLLPLDVPYQDLTSEQKQIVVDGSPQHKFLGLTGFFQQLERKKYKMHVRVFLSRWRSYQLCPACGGTRLRPEALAVRIGGKNLAEICAAQNRGRPKTSARTRTDRLAAASRPIDARAGDQPAGILGRGGAGISLARSDPAHAQRRHEAQNMRGG